MTNWRSPDVGQLARAGYLAWWLLWLLALAALVYAVWRLIGHTPYRIDIDVYRMGGQAWLDGHPLYSHDCKFHTPIGLNLPFTYPPLAAVMFCPFAWLRHAGRQRRDHADHAGAAARLDDDRADSARCVEHLTRAARAGLVAPLVADRGHRGRGDDLAGAHRVELRLRTDQRRADDAGDRRLRAAPHAVATWAAAGPGDRAQTHSGGVPAVFPAAPRPPGGAHCVGVFRGRRRWPGSRWPGTTPGSTGPTPCTTPIGSARQR